MRSRDRSPDVRWRRISIASSRPARGSFRLPGRCLRRSLTRMSCAVTERARMRCAIVLQPLAGSLCRFAPRPFSSACVCKVKAYTEISACVSRAIPSTLCSSRCSRSSLILIEHFLCPVGATGVEPRLRVRALCAVSLALAAPRSPLAAAVVAVRSERQRGRPQQRTPEQRGLQRPALLPPRFWSNGLLLQRNHRAHSSPQCRGRANNNSEALSTHHRRQRAARTTS